MTQELTIALFTTLAGFWFLQATICAYLFTKIHLMNQQSKSKDEFLRAQTNLMNRKSK